MVSILGAKLPIILEAVTKVQAKTYIEIGCYRCNTMKEIRLLDESIRVIGFDLFAPHDGVKDDKGVGAEHAPLDGPPVTITEAERMGFEVYAGDSKITLPEILSGLEVRHPVFVFLDGGHSYETARSDYCNVAKYLPDATVIIDDVNYPGVARLIRQIDNRAKHWSGYGMIQVNPKLPWPSDHD